MITAFVLADKALASTASSKACRPRPVRLLHACTVTCLMVFAAAAAPCRGADPSDGLTITRGQPALAGPQDSPAGEEQRYGLGQVFQVGPQTAGVSCNVRTVGKGHWDFENGTDIVIFDSLAGIGNQKRIVTARNVETQDPATGKKRVAVTYPIQIGFVPLGAKRADGTAHPHAGTGFGFSHSLSLDLNDEGYFTWDQPGVETSNVYQFAYDGKTFRMQKEDRRTTDTPVKTSDDAWTITAPGMSTALADGDDLLLPVSASDGEKLSTGISRWRREGDEWRLVSFTRISTGMEPSLVRDVDGSLLFTDRGESEEGEAVRVWRSKGAEEEWVQLFRQADLRSNAPVAMYQTADGTPFISGNAPGTFRATLNVWPLTADRKGCGPAVVARDCDSDFGPAPTGTLWFADHPMATTVRLADGAWHSLFSYRVMAFSTEGVGGETLTPKTGCYIEEIRSAKPARPTWGF